MSEVAKKSDGTKADLSLNPLSAQELMARAFMFGEKKYQRYNYCNGFDSHRLVAAALRHISQYQDGEDFDPESGVSHLGHALASIAMLVHTIELGTNTDTRRGKNISPSTNSKDAELVYLDDVPDGHISRATRKEIMYDTYVNGPIPTMHSKSGSEE